MGRIVYDPRSVQKKQIKSASVKASKLEEQNELVNNHSFQDAAEKAEERYARLLNNIESVKEIGDVECEYVMYIEDYVYTYLYQFAKVDLSKEQAALIVGQYYEESKEAIITGIIPVDASTLKPNENWIGDESVNNLLDKKEQYFPGESILGWLHMQPGYGTMVSSKEVKVHRHFFPEEYSILLLVDPINKVETFYVYEEETLKEQTGFYIFYDKNPAMQRYMLDNPYMLDDRDEPEEDSVVKQFREIGTRRKREYQTRQKTNYSLVAGCLVLLALGAVITRMNEDTNLFNQDTQPTFSDQQIVQAGEPPTIVNEAAPTIEPTQSTIEPTQTPVLVEEDEEDEIEEPQATVDISSLNTPTDAVIDDTISKLNEEDLVKDDIVEGAMVDNNVEIIEESTTSESIDDEQETAPAISDEVQEADDDFIVYTVEEGDTIRRVSEKHFGVESRVWDIIGWNDLSDGDQIYVGQRLRILVE
ncbi:MAG: hypothetical protein ATN35_13360 [Epulopiscium sp. Nele67-Bin004]|nr:MAG: hypothetical protein ATN35_13360 [Epulopiscium sp. Nele67-Bin004]